MFADTSPAPPPPEPAWVTVSAKDSSAVLAALDTPLVLTKGAQREQALLRRAVFLNTQVVVVRPPGEATAAQDRYRWTLKTYLQRQVCVTSITGMFACTAGETVALKEAESGEAPLAPDATFALADAAQARVTAGLTARAAAVFDSDRRTSFDPVLKAAGVTASAPGTAPKPAPARKR